MNNKINWRVIFLVIIVFGVFFWPVLFKRQLPFPGDLLVGQYAPWNSYSYLGYNAGGVPHKAQGIDVIRQLYPWKHLTIEMIKTHQLPWWNPYQFAGNPHLANFQSGVFYPLNFIFFLFPFMKAWMIYIVVQPLLAGFFTYLFLKAIKLNPLAAFTASLAFAFGLYQTVWLEWGNLGHSFLWLPLALLATEKIVKENNFKWFWILVLALASSFLAGYIQIFLYVLSTAILYFLFRLFSGEKLLRKRKLIVFILAGIVTLIISLPQLIPTWRLFSQSGRWPYSSEKAAELLMPFWHLVTAWVPDFFGNPASRNYWHPGTYIERVTYIGVLPLFFALFSLIFLRKQKQVFFWSGLALFILLFSVNNPIGRLPYLLKVPAISTTVPTRMLGVFSFCLAVLAGLGMDLFLRVKYLGVAEKKKIRKSYLLFGAFYFSLWLVVFGLPKLLPQAEWISRLSITKRNLIIPTGICLFGGGLMIVSTIFKKTKLIFAGIFVLTLFDLNYSFKKITPFSPPEFVYPEAKVLNFLKDNQGINRFWGYGSAYIESNFSVMTKTFSTEGYDPLFIKRYGELISASADGQIKKIIPRADVSLTGGFGEEALRNNPYRQKLLNLLGVKYILHKNDALGENWQPDEQTFPKEIYRLEWQETPWQIYENKEVLPRIFLVSDYQLAKKDQEIVGLIMDSNFPLDQKLILEEPLDSNFIIGKKATGKVLNLDYQPNEIKMTVEASGNMLLFISDNYYEQWRAEIDGQSTKIYRADYSFRAVPVPGGIHEVRFYYQSDYVLK